MESLYERVHTIFAPPIMFTPRIEDIEYEEVDEEEDDVPASIAPRFIKFKKRDTQAAIYELIEVQTEGMGWSRFDVIYEGEGYNLNVGGEVTREYSRSGDGICTPIEWHCDAHIKIDKHHVWDENGDEIDSDFDPSWIS